MQTKRQNTDIRAVMISIILHAILFGLLILGSFYHKVDIMGGGEGNGEVLDVVMVDTGSAAHEWGRLQQQKKGQTETQTRPEVIEEQQEKLKQELERQKEIEYQKQLEKQQALEKQQEAERLKQLAEQKKQEEKVKQEALEKQRELEAKAKEAAEAAKLKAEVEAKRLAALAKQAEEEAKAKAAAEAKAKAEKAKAEAEAKAKAEKAKAEAEAKAKAEKAKAEAEAKAKAEKAKAEAKAKAEKAKADAQRKAEQAALDDFMNGGDIGGGSASVGGNANRQGSQGTGAARGAGDGGKTGDQYAGVIKKEIQRRFLKEPSFANKVCVVEVEFLRDGTIANYRRVSGPDDICHAALSAVARTKKVPPAPTDEIYNKYKKVPVDFKLR
ncbi:cell envelope integrity inner membrane protein TolA [Pasteurella multocida subsp. multocida OH4807]|nr:cell envelope integrity inner membrane protein TolA [Pasteurella multocida subsp. multocida OH4807]